MGGLGLFNGCGCTSCSNAGKRPGIRQNTVSVSNGRVGLGSYNSPRYSVNGAYFTPRTKSLRRYRNSAPYGLASGLGDSSALNITPQSITDWATCFFNPFDWTCNPDPLRQGQSYPSPISYVNDPVTTIEQITPDSPASTIVGTVQTVTSPTNMIVGVALIGIAAIVLVMSK